MESNCLDITNQLLNDPSGTLTGLAPLLERASEDSKENQRANVEWNNPEKPNFVYVVRGKIALQATEDKIIILLDKFRTGFECRVCDGEGTHITCPSCDGTGANRLGGNCSTCAGDPSSFVDKECASCNGRGSTIIIPDSAKTLPTTGLIVSAGPKCEIRQIGERVLFGAHTGYMLPLKGNIRLRVMREYEPIALVHMLETSGKVLGDFIQYEQPMDNS